MDDLEFSMEDYNFDRIRENDLVEGVVAEIHDDYLEVDIKSFTYGTIYLDKYSSDRLTSFDGVVSVGDTIKAVVKKINDEPSQILMSRIPLVQREKFYKVKEAYEKKEIVTAKVIKLVNQGMIISYLDTDIFLPNSLIDITIPEDREKFLNTKMQVRIVTFDERKRKIVASRKDVLMDAYKEERAKQLEEVKVGDILDGEIVNFQPFGIFVKIGYIQGLMRFSQVTHRKSEKAEEILKVGDKIKVKVIRKEGTKIDLSRKALIPTPFEEFVKEQKVSSEVRGKLVQKLAFGMIFELSKDVTGLLHKSEYSWNPNDNLANNLKIGDELQLAIIGIDHKKERISLSKKALDNNPWGRVTVKKGDIVKAFVSEILPGKGIMASVDGVDGFISIKDLSNDHISKIEDYFSLKDEIEAMVIEVNKQDWILNMSIRIVQEKAERAEFEKYMKNQEVDEDAKIGDLYKDILEK